MGKAKELDKDLVDVAKQAEDNHVRIMPMWCYFDDETDTKKASAFSLGVTILEAEQYLYIQSGKDIDLFQYSQEAGYWKLITKQNIKLIIASMLKDEAVWTAKVQSDTEKYIFSSIDIKQASDTIDNVKPHLIHFKNGTYNIETDKLEPNKPENWFFGGRDYELDMTNKDTPYTDQWLTESVGDAKKFIMEYVGYAFYRSYRPFQKFAVLQADGGDGKSTYFNWFNEVIGANNVSNVSLQELTDPKKEFTLAELVRMNANYYADISSGIITDPSLIKTVTGDDNISTKAKYKDGVSTRLYAKLFFGANNLPAFKDSSRGFGRRPCIVAFHNISDFSKRFKLEDIYKEIPAFTYKCLLAFKSAMDNEKLSETAQMKLDLNNWLIANNHVQEFVEEYGIIGADYFVKKVYAYDSYKNFCFENGYKAMSNQKLTVELKRLNIFDTRSRFDGVQARIYTGFKLKPSEVQTKLHVVDN